MNERNGISIDVQIDSPDDYLEGTPLLLPGSTLEGRVEVRADKDFQCRGIVIEAGWETEGRGRKDKDAPAVKEIDKTEFQEGVPYSERFTLRLPLTPYSFAGELITINWTLKAKVDFVLWPDLNDEVEFILRPASQDDSGAGDSSASQEAG